MNPTTQSYRKHDRSLRLNFRFELGELTLVDRLELEMTALHTNDVEAFKPEERSGFWIEEVHDQHGRALYRRSMPHPMVRRSEGHNDETVPHAPSCGSRTRRVLGGRALCPEVDERDPVDRLAGVDRGSRADV